MAMHHRGSEREKETFGQKLQAYFWATVVVALLAGLGIVTYTGISTAFK